SLDVAELAPGIVEAARAHFADVNGDVLSRPEVHLALEDGRNFLLRGSDAYDLITVELTSVWFQGACNLYSRQFYDLARARLRPAPGRGAGRGHPDQHRREPLPRVRAPAPRPRAPLSPRRGARRPGRVRAPGWRRSRPLIRRGGAAGAACILRIGEQTVHHL